MFISSQFLIFSHHDLISKLHSVSICLPSLFISLFAWKGLHTNIVPVPNWSNIIGQEHDEQSRVFHDVLKERWTGFIDLARTIMQNCVSKTNFSNKIQSQNQRSLVYNVSFSTAKCLFALIFMVSLLFGKSAAAAM